MSGSSGGSDEQGKCTCLGGPNDPLKGDSVACIKGEVYGPCSGSDNCGGVCEPEGACDCPLHVNRTHDSGYGGIYHD